MKHGSKGNYTRSIRRIGLSLALGAIGVTSAVTAAGASSQPAKVKANLANIPIVIGQNSSGTSNFPVYAAISKGYFAQEGLNVTMETLGSDPVTMAAFTSKSINMIFGGAPDVIEYLANGVIPRNGRKFFAELAGSVFDIVGAKGITSVAGAEGKAVSISGPNDTDELYNEAVMQHDHVPLNSVTFVTSGGPVPRLATLQNGTAALSAIPNTSRQQSAQVGTVLVKANDTPIVFIGTSLFASAALVKRPTELKKFDAAVEKAIGWTKKNEIAATALCVQTTGATSATCSSGIQDEFERNISGEWTWDSTLALQTAGITETINSLKVILNQSQYNWNGLTAAKIDDTAIAGTTP